MDYKKFTLPEMKTTFDAERANRDTQKQLRNLFLAALLLSIVFLELCYMSFSLPVFLIGLGLTALGLLGMWFFHKRVQNTERLRAALKAVLPAEELILDPEGYLWTQRGAQPRQLHIPWTNVKQISFDPLNSYIMNRQNQKTKSPRILFDNQDEIMRFIEQNLDLKKTTETKRWRDDKYTAVVYTRRPE